MRWSRALPVAFCAFICANAGLVMAEQVVPPDESLPLEEYEALGMPDPAESWKAHEYREALRVLEQLERQHFPRYGSRRSGILFERLLVTDKGQADPFFHESARTVEDIFRDISPLSRIYGPRQEDDFFFDRELIEIQVANLEEHLKVYRSKSEAREHVAKLKELMSKAKTDEERDKISRLFRSNQELLDLSDQLLFDELQYLLMLGMRDCLQESARVAWKNYVMALLPRAPDFLSRGNLTFLSALLGTAADLEVNAAFRDELTSLANAIEASQT
jgi:hypothetical protein